MDIRDNFTTIKKGGLKILIFCSLLELLIFGGYENLFGCLLFIYAWCIMSRYVLTPYNLRFYLLPTLVVFGYIFSYYFLPLLATLVENKPLTFKFEVPYLTFINNFINVNIIIIAFCLSKKCQPIKMLLNKIWTKLGYFSQPTPRQIWALGIIGFLCLGYIVATQKVADSFADLEANTEGGFIISMIGQIANSYTSFPLFLLFPFLLGMNKTNKVNKKNLAIYFILYVLACMATTRRSLIMYPIASVILANIILNLYKGKKIFTGKKSVYIIIAFWIITGPLADIAFAMALNRHNVSGKGTFFTVVETLSDGEKLHNLRQLALKAIDNSNDFGWSEYYVDNIFMDRFCNLRVQDATLFYAQKLGFADQGMKDFAKSSILRDLPTFLLNLLGEKREVTTTPADYICMRYFNTSYLVGNRVSGDTGTGLFWLGYWYYPFALVIYLFLFIMFSSFVKTTNGNCYYPVPVVASLMMYFTYLINSYGILWSIHVLLRNCWQEIIIYCVIFAIIRKFIK